MQVDSYFAIGSSHNVCEDYALHGVVNERPFGVLSDGCSSSPYTDFGSRFLCLGAQEALRLSPPEHFNQQAVLPLACTLLGKALPWECLDATLLFAYATKNLIFTLVSGDGVVVARRRDGSIHTTETVFNNSAPFYLSYQLNSSRFKTYTTEACGIRTTTRMQYDHELAAGEAIDEEPYIERVSSEPQAFWDITAYSREVFDLVVLLSDGVHSFQKKPGQSLPLQAVLQQLMQFKQLKGEFVKRRCKRFLRKFCVENNWSHYDDFSCVALYDDEEVQNEFETTG